MKEWKQIMGQRLLFYVSFLKYEDRDTITELGFTYRMFKTRIYKKRLLALKQTISDPTWVHKSQMCFRSEQFVNIYQLFVYSKDKIAENDTIFNHAFLI